MSILALAMVALPVLSILFAQIMHRTDGEKAAAGALAVGHITVFVVGVAALLLWALL